MKSGEYVNVFDNWSYHRLQQDIMHVFLLTFYSFVIDSTQSLAHACRRSIVIELARKRRYQERHIRSLPIPSLLQEYLLFLDYGPKASSLIVDSLGYASKNINICSSSKIGTDYYEETFEKWNMWTTFSMTSQRNKDCSWNYIMNTVHSPQTKPFWGLFQSSILTKLFSRGIKQS